jgi:diguanylate cyclase (GGDEF)-like protein
MGMSLAQGLLSMLGLQLALYGVGWACAAFYVPRHRRIVFDWLGFTLSSGLALGLLVVRGHVPDWLGRTGADLLLLLGFVSMWRGAQRFLLGRITQEPLQLLVLGAAAIVWFGEVHIDPDARVLCLLLALSWVALHCTWQGYSTMRKEFGARAALTLGITGCTVAGAFMAHALGAFWRVRPLEWAPGDSMHHGFPFLLMAAAALVNLGLGFQVFTRMVRQLEHLSRHDALTGLLNRGAFTTLLSTEWQRFQRKPQAFSVLALDVDHFKFVNDSHGHAVGDEVLANLGALLRRHARESDGVGRSGGEEFLLLLVDQNLLQAGQAAERLRAAVAECSWPLGLKMSVSVGVATALVGDASEAAVLRRADQALYAAKAQGRNRVVISGWPAALTAPGDQRA